MDLSFSQLDVSDPLLDCLLQQRRLVGEDRVFGVYVPRLNRTAIFWLQQEVLRVVVYDDRLVEVPPQHRQVFYEQVHAFDRVVAVQSMVDEVVRSPALQVPSLRSLWSPQ